MLMQIVWLTVVSSMIPHWCHAAVKQDYYNLYNQLFDTTTYKKEIRPADNENSTTMIYTVLDLLSLVEVDEKQQTLVTSARLRMSWDDDYLAWDPSVYGNIETLLVPQKNIYLPDIVVGNSVTAQTRLGYDDLQVRIYSTGIIDWEPTVLISTSCDIDITYFPFDSQTCYIVFETAVSTNNEIDINIDIDEIPISLEDFSENGQWEVIDTSSENLSDLGSVTRIRFGILLKRRRTFYVLNIILPIFFLSLCASLVFALPADEGEKMGTGITVLLAFAVYLTILSDLVPNTSLQVSILGLYLTTLLGMSAMSIIVCVFILRLHFRDVNRPVGRKTTSVTHFLRRLMCLERKDVSKNQVEPSNSGEEDEMTDMKQEMKGRNSPSLMLSTDSKCPITWQDVAHALDLFCFIAFSLFTVIITVACMAALEAGANINKPEL